MQPVVVQPNNHKKRKHNCSDSEIETSGSGKKQKVSLFGPSSFVNFQLVVNTEQPAETVNTMVDRPLENFGGESVENSLAVQIRNFKLKKSTQRRLPDAKLLQLLNEYMKARNMKQSTAASEIPTAHAVLSKYRNSHPQNWSILEPKILAWMRRNIDIGLINTAPAFEAITAEDPLINANDISSTPAPPTPMRKYGEIYTAPIISSDFKRSETQPTKIIQTSVMTLISTPKYLCESEPHPVPDLPLTFISLPQSLQSLQLDSILFPYISLPKDTQYSRAPKDQSAHENLVHVEQEEIKHVQRKENPVEELQNSKYSSKEAALAVLRKFGKPLHVKEIARLCVKEGLIISTCKTIDKTIAGAIYTEIKKSGDLSRFKKVSEGVFSINTT